MANPKRTNSVTLLFFWGRRDPNSIYMGKEWNKSLPSDIKTTITSEGTKLWRRSLLKIKLNSNIKIT